jgi:DNA-binding NtrC family response regulator
MQDFAERNPRSPVSGLSEDPAQQGCETIEDRQQQPVVAPTFALVLLHGRVDGQRSTVLGRAAVQLGREVEGEPHLRLDDPRASRQHAELRWSDIHCAYFVHDLNSRNGVHVNGARISRERLRPGDVLRIGETVFRLAVVDPAAAALAPLQPPFVGRSASLRRTLELTHRLAPSSTPVLVLGATGTGKDLVAQVLHRHSARPGPMIAVNCAALPGHLVESELFGHEKGAFSGADGARAGLFRAAEGGTLFLDEVGELPIEIQAKLLRALDARAIRSVGAVAERPINVRIVAATNRELTDEVIPGRFRADLYARLSESVIRIDPLRDRPEDLEPLWHHLVAELGGCAIELCGDAFEAMALHSWPYNVRELRQLVRTALQRRGSGALTVDDLPAAMRRATPGEAAAARLAIAPSEAPKERQLRRLLEEFHGSVKEVAAFLHKDRKQIYRWLDRHHIDPDAYRPVS